MNVLWVCNQCVPQIADELHIPSSSKEGWLSGLFDALMSEEGKFYLGLAFPHTENKDFVQEKVAAFGFAEDTTHPENYDEQVTVRLKEIIDQFKPDVVHIFGTEYGHSLSAAKALNDPSRLLIGFQGVCGALADAYLTGVDEEWVTKTTLRDSLKDDNLKLQQEKFMRRAEHEKEAAALAGYLAGRTRLDREYAAKYNPDAEYVVLNETMRGTFYTGEWEKDKAVPQRIFVSQCDYPIKGFHIMIKALAELKKKYPDAHIRVAGNTITGVGGIKKKILISTYGKYLKHLMKETGTEKSIDFLGTLNAEQMKEEYLSCSVFVLCSVMENSPNCLGEAMLLGTPCVASNVGGVADILEHERDGILYDDCNPDNLCTAIAEVFEDEAKGGEKMKAYGEASKEDARRKHNAKSNADALIDLYETIVQRQKTK
jgi:glycosyltransferase involved in cell wall biosynthesis